VKQNAATPFTADLTEHCFTFTKRTIYHEPSELIRHAVHRSRITHADSSTGNVTVGGMTASDTTAPVASVISVGAETMTVLVTSRMSPGAESSEVKHDKTHKRKHRDKDGKHSSHKKHRHRVETNNCPQSMPGMLTLEMSTSVISTPAMLTPAISTISGLSATLTPETLVGTPCPPQGDPNVLSSVALVGKAVIDTDMEGVAVAAGDKELVAMGMENIAASDIVTMAMKIRSDEALTVSRDNVVSMATGNKIATAVVADVVGRSINVRSSADDRSLTGDTLCELRGDEELLLTSSNLPTATTTTTSEMLTEMVVKCTSNRLVAPSLSTFVTTYSTAKHTIADFKRGILCSGRHMYPTIAVHGVKNKYYSEVCTTSSQN